MLGAVAIVATACAGGASGSPAATTAASPGPPTTASSPALSSTATVRAAQPADERARVRRVIDGDTVEVEVSGAVERVRYVGIDAPELYGDGAPQPFAREARDLNERLVDGRELVLRRDVSDRDRFGRLLRYVYLDDQLVNRALVAAGLARSQAYPPDTRLQDELNEAQRQAQAKRLGLWGVAHPPTALPTRGATAAPIPTLNPAPPPSPLPAAAQTAIPTATAVPEPAREPTATATAPPTRASPLPTPQTTSAPPPGCLIKGNISADGEKIYHVPGGRSYDRTVIDLSRGERWFCSEQEAQAAGWRRARQ
jgi:micrococcal nuclease